MDEKTVGSMNKILLSIIRLNDTMDSEDEKLYVLNQIYQTISSLKSEICINGNFEPYKYDTEDED